MGLTRGAQVSGRALFEGRDLLTARPEEMKSIRGAKIGMIFQDPLSSLHPFYRVGWQIVEMIRLHDHEVSKRGAHQRAVDLLTLVSIPQADRRARDLPHPVSPPRREPPVLRPARAHAPRPP